MASASSRKRISRQDDEKRKRPSGRGLFWYVCASLTLFGLGWQLYSISVLYQRYETVTETVVEVPSQLAAPALSLCFRYAELLDRRRFSLEVTNDSNEVSILEVGHTQNKMTVAKIFEMTPDGTELITECMFRRYNSYLRRFLRTNNECMNKFSVLKYFRVQFICYKFSMIQSANVNRVYSYHRLKNSVVNPGMFYDLRLNSSQFKQVNNIEVMIYQDRDSYPQTSKVFSIQVTRDMNPLTFRPKVNYFSVSYGQFKNHLLPAPYSSNCTTYTDPKVTSRDDCVDQCITKRAIAVLRKVPFTPVIHHPYGLKHISMDDLDDAIFAQKLQRVESSCLDTCWRPDCKDDLVSTHLIRSETESEIRFRVYAPGQPNIVTKFYASMSLTEYLIYLLSCFGIWYSVSVFDLIRFPATLASRK
ncbi:hypothetical protein HDE_03439 [Halotydeus destructor]|nr:hypothetical protein HDE_03439 [Halotydeus destructor]